MTRSYSSFTRLSAGAMLAARWLLQLHRPAPPRSDDEMAAEVERNYRWNFTVNLLDGTAFWFGISFISSTTIVPLFITRVAAEAGLASPLVAVGMAAVIAQGAWFVPQLFTANVVERLARKKPVVVNLGLFLERLPMWVIVLAAVVAASRPWLALMLFLLAYAWHGFGAGMVATSWQDLLARCFPVERRGRFFGLTMFAGAGTGALGAVASAWILEHYAYPLNFTLTFLTAAAAVQLSWFFLALTREPVQPSAAPRQSNRQFWRTLPAIIRRDDNFRRFLVARLLLALGGMGSGFVTVSALERWQVADSVVGVYTADYLIGQTIGNLIFGFLADRYGHKLSLEISGLAAALGYALAWLAPSPGWAHAVFFWLGFYVGGIIVSGILVTLEFTDPPRRPTYVGVANTGVGLVSMAAPLLGAALAGVGFGWLFAASAGVSVVAAGVMRWWVREPRYHVVGS